jgi:hypothetical protein
MVINLYINALTKEKSGLNKIKALRESRRKFIIMNNSVLGGTVTINTN